jgi:hypothetical protein
MKTLFTFRQALEIVMFIMIVLFSKALKSQVPDSIYYIPFTFTTEETTGTLDSQAFIVYESKILPNTGVMTFEAIDKVMDSAQVAEYAFNIIYRNENLNWLDAARLMQREKLQRLYAPVNSIIRDMEGYGFFVKTRLKFGTGFEGRWIARINGGDIIWLEVDRLMNVTETTMQGDPIENGRIGKMLIYTENRFKVQTLFNDVIDFRDYWNKELDSDFFVIESDGNKVIMRKID